MKRTKILRLQQPEPGDEYNHNTLSSNVTAIDRFMANIGGNVAKRSVPLSNVLTMRSGFTLEGGSFTVYGNGLAWIEVNFVNTNSLVVNQTTGLIDGGTVADVNPEFTTLISQPLTSGGRGTPVSGYIAPDTTRIVLRLLNGYYSSNRIPAGTQLQLSGTYPLAELPKSIGLEQMRSNIFDYEVHTSNLNKIDAVAKKLKSSLPQLDNSKVFTPASGVTVVGVTCNRNTNGMVSFALIFRRNTAIPASFSGNIGNLVIGTFNNPDWVPERYMKLVGTSFGPMVTGEISPVTGALSITATGGKSLAIPAGTELRLVGSWPYNGS